MLVPVTRVERSKKKNHIFNLKYPKPIYVHWCTFTNHPVSTASDKPIKNFSFIIYIFQHTKTKSNHVSYRFKIFNFQR